MVSREKPYRSKAPASFFVLSQQALQSTFFLVQETGLTSFVLKDEQGKVFKASLGSTISCSCGGGRTEHCIHTLYILLKLFRVLPDNPIIWQLSYIDSEINWLISNRHSPAVEKKRKSLPNASQAVRIPLEEEFGCPICQEDLKDPESLVYCKVGCGHNFHIKCMKVWAEHKVSQHDLITCPLCRNDWGTNVLSELSKLLRLTKKKPTIHSNSTCINCGASPIIGTKFHCVLCPDFDLCTKCHRSSHKEHPFIQKTAPNSAWEPVVRVDPGLIQVREFAPEDYEMLQQLDAKPCLSEYLFSLLPEDYETKGLVCGVCKSEQKTRWKRMVCGHSVHDVCALQCFRDENYLCSVDGMVALLGLGSYKEKRKEVKESPLSVMGLHVGNPVVAFRQRRKPPSRKNEAQSTSSNRTQVFDLPPLIVTRLVNKS